MSLEKDTIITLENKEKYVIENITYYGGIKYALAKSEDEKSEIIFEEVLNWLEKHQNLFLATDIEPYSLGFEPEWLKRKRLSDRYKKKRTLKQYTTKECQKILEYRKSGLTYKEIGKLVNRSAISIEHKINRMKGSELF